MPFVDAFFQKSSGDVTRCKGASGKDYLSVDVVLEFTCAAVFFNEVAISNIMILSAKGAMDFSRVRARERWRRAGSLLRTIDSFNY